MLHLASSLRTPLAVALVFVCGATLLFAGPLEGRWRLVEQTYDTGSSNLVAGENPLRLEFYREHTSLRGRIWTADGTEARGWPALDAAGAVRALHVDELHVAPTEDSVRASYRVDPSEGDDLVLEIGEEYRVVEKGTALVGTVRVRFSRDGEPRGSYVLHRRFERER